VKKVLAFDLDDTLALSKSNISQSMADTLTAILDHYDICIISGGKYELFQSQVISRLDLTEEKLQRLHLMPTCGTRYYRYDPAKKDWILQYAEDLSAEEKTLIRRVLEESAKELGLWPENPAGEVIEDRDSQLTYSALGQLATGEDKYAWDPDGTKKMAIRDLAAGRLPDLEVRAAGTTSIDVTKKGIDKAHGMRKLIEALGITKEDILFFGDKLQPGGNDYPVKAIGIDSIEVTKWEDTVEKLQGILNGKMPTVAT
jgi:phosphomannomutase